MSEAKYTVVGGSVRLPDGTYLKNQHEAAAELNRLASERDAEERRHSKTIDERDYAEEALSQMYFLIIGESPQWSNLFGHKEAIEAVDDAQRTMRATIKSLTAQRDAAVEALRKIGWVVDKVTGADFAGSPTVAWGMVRGIVEAAMAATTTPAPSVNAELLKACKAAHEQVAGAVGDACASTHRRLDKATEILAAAIAKAEKSN